MIKETVKYTNLNGQEAETDLYFNMGKMEILEIGIGNLGETLAKITKEKNNQQVLKYFKKIVHMAYGERSEDGKRFIKNEEVLDRFKSSPAYDEFLFGLLMDESRAVKFVNGLFPKEVIEEMHGQIAGEKSAETGVVKETL